MTDALIYHGTDARFRIIEKPEFRSCNRVSAANYRMSALRKATRPPFTLHLLGWIKCIGIEPLPGHVNFLIGWLSLRFVIPCHCRRSRLSMAKEGAHRDGEIRDGGAGAADGRPCCLSGRMSNFPSYPRRGWRRIRRMRRSVSSISATVSSTILPATCPMRCISPTFRYVARRNGCPWSITHRSSRRNCSHAGVRPGQTVVVYSNGDDATGATMAAYILERVGFPKTAIVDGGSSAYQGHPTTRAGISLLYPGTVAGAREHRHLGVVSSQVKALLGKPDVVIIDARPNK